MFHIVTVNLLQEAHGQQTCSPRDGRSVERLPQREVGRSSICREPGRDRLQSQAGNALKQAGRGGRDSVRKRRTLSVAVLAQIDNAQDEPAGTRSRKVWTVRLPARTRRIKDCDLTRKGTLTQIYLCRPQASGSHTPHAKGSNGCMHI